MPPCCVCACVCVCVCIGRKAGGSVHVRSARGAITQAVLHTQVHGASVLHFVCVCVFVCVHWLERGRWEDSKDQEEEKDTMQAGNVVRDSNKHKQEGGGYLATSGRARMLKTAHV